MSGVAERDELHEPPDAGHGHVDHVRLSRLVQRPRAAAAAVALAAAAAAAVDAAVARIVEQRAHFFVWGWHGRGAGEQQHFVDVFQKTKASGALAASVFHKNIFGIPDLKRFLKKHNIEVR